jgi:hypothetical protein
MDTLSLYIFSIYSETQTKESVKLALAQLSLYKFRHLLYDLAHKK